MKSFLVLIAVVLAAGGLFFVLKGDETQGSGGSTSVIERDTGANEDPVTQGPDSLVNVDLNGGREVSDVETVATVVEPQDLAAVGALGAGNLRGSVANLKGEPIGGARVVLTRYGADAFIFGDVDHSSDVETKTGSDGTFEFKNVPAYESYALIATHPEYSRTEAPSIVVQDGVVTESAPIVLGFGVAVRGTVTDTGGNAVPGAQIVLSQNVFAAQLASGEEGMKTETDEAGRYEFRNVTPQQNYAMAVAADGYGSLTLTGIAVLEKEDTVRDMVLEVTSMIAGTVMSSTGDVIEGATIQAFSQRNPQSRSMTDTKSLETGEFEISDIAPGPYLLVAMHPRYGRNTQNRVESGEMTVSIVLEPLPVVTGQVVQFTNGAPVTRFEAQLRRVNATSVEGFSMAEISTRAKFDNPEGRFEIVVPSAGQYMVEAIAPGFADTYSEPFEATMGADVSGIAVRMTQGGTLSGRVVGAGGVPVEGAVVETHDKEWSDDPFWQSLGAAAPGNASESTTRTDQDGNFRLESLTPAQYQVVIRHRDYAQETVKDLVVTEGQDLRIQDVNLPRGAVISGMVLGPSGRPMAGAIVKLYPTVAGTRQHTVQTNKAGEYMVKNVREGTYKVHATRPRVGTDNPFQENIDMKNTQRVLTVQNDQTLSGQDFKLSDR